VRACVRYNESMETLDILVAAFAPTLLFIAIGAIAVFYFRKNGSGNKIEEKNDQSFLLIQQQLQEIARANQDLKLSNEQLKSELSEKLNTKLSESHKVMSDSVQMQFKESQQLIKDITNELGNVRKTGEQVVGFTEQLKQLQDILQNSKQRGTLGEYFLKTTIESVLPVDSYEFQYTFKNGDVADAVIKLPDGIIPIDSKFSLENYNNYVSETNAEQKEKYRKIFREDLKKRVQETSKYIKPNEGTLDFAFMYIPSEGIYYDLLTSKLGSGSKDESQVNAVNSQSFLEYASREKRVIVVSPTTLHAYLQTVMQGLRAMRIEKQAGNIIKHVGELQKHISDYQTYHEKIGNTLSTVVNHYNTSGKKLRLVSRDTQKITGAGDVFEPELLDKPHDEQAE